MRKSSVFMAFSALTGVVPLDGCIISDYQSHKTDFAVKNVPSCFWEAAMSGNFCGHKDTTTKSAEVVPRGGM